MDYGFDEKTETSGVFSSYDSMALVRDAVGEGILAPMRLVSPMFGGAEDDSNTLYVPPLVIQFKDSVDSMLAEALQSGKKVRGVKIEPRYKGDSLVPSSIYIKAGGDVDIEETINIW